MIPSFKSQKRSTQLIFAFVGFLGLLVAPLIGRAEVVASKGRALSVMLPAKSAPVELDLTKTVVIVVDMQNDFGSKGGMFDLMGFDLTGIQQAVTPTAKVLAAARQAGVKVLYIKSAEVGVMIPGPDGKPHAVLGRDTWNTEVLPALKPEVGDLLVYKTKFSGFFETELDAVLKKQGATQLIFTGCTTSVCVESTIRDAFFRDYSCVLLADCTAEPCGAEFPRSNYEASLYLIEKRFGSVSSSTDLLKSLEATKATAKRLEQ